MTFSGIVMVKTDTRQFTRYDSGTDRRGRSHCGRVKEYRFDQHRMIKLVGSNRSYIGE